MITIGNIQSVCLLIILNNRDNGIVSILLLLLSHILDEIVVNLQQVCFWPRVDVLGIDVVFRNSLVRYRGHSTFNLTHI